MVEEDTDRWNKQEKKSNKKSNKKQAIAKTPSWELKKGDLLDHEESISNGQSDL